MTDRWDDVERRLRAFLADISEEPTPAALSGFVTRVRTPKAHGGRRPSVAVPALTVFTVVLIGTVTWVTHRTQTRQQTPANAVPALVAPTPGTPSPRFSEAMAYDPMHRQTVLFGGDDGNQSLADTWTWDGHSWAQQHPAASPPADEGAALAYDPDLGAVLLVGGDAFTATASCPDPYRVWEGERLSEGGPGHSPAANPCAGPVGRRDMWVWDGRTWRLLGALPMQGEVDGLAWDASSHQMVAIVDGHQWATWVLSNTTWTEANANWGGDTEPDVVQVAMDPATGHPLALIFGAGPPCNAGARAMSPSPGDHGPDAPGLNSQGQAINCGVEISPGDYSGGYIASTWEWIGQGWKQLFSADMPLPPAPMASDAPLHAILLVTQSGAWTWNGAAWTDHRLSPAPALPTPFGSAFGAIAEDALGHVVYLAAGTNCTPSGTCTSGAVPGNATWVWDGRAWLEGFR